MKNDHIYLIGIDRNGLTPEKKGIIVSCTDIFCAGRFLDLLRPALSMYPQIRVFSLSPLAESLTRMEGLPVSSKIGILAGGDPLFFGIGRTLCRRFGKEAVVIHPAVSSMQSAFARFKIPWDDACFLSVHGRDIKDVLPQIQCRKKVCILTDKRNSPAAVASCLLESAGDGNDTCCKVYVAENLDQADERLTGATLSAIAEKKFSDLSVMIIVWDRNGRQDPRPHFGLLEDEIIHSRGLITKNEVRAATLHALGLPSTGVFWDIGAGSGSISIEAAAIAPLLRIFSIESQAEQIDNIRKNRLRFAATSITALHGHAPEILATLPEPDRVFVGGSGGSLQDILEYSAARLRPEGRIVVNGVLEQTCLRAPEILHRLGLEVAISKLSIKRSRYPELQTVELNPISIIQGVRGRGEKGERV